MSKREFEIGDVYDENLVKQDKIVIRNTLESIASVVTKERSKVLCFTPFCLI